MNIDYEKLGKAAWMAWVDLKPAEFNRSVGGEKIARAVISESGLLEEVERLKKAVETLKHECAHCDSEGYVDSGGSDPNGNPIMIPCHRCHCYQIGSKWMKDSSLETWFPYTAKEIEELKAKVRRVEEVISLMQEQCSDDAKVNGYREFLTAAMKG